MNQFINSVMVVITKSYIWKTSSRVLPWSMGTADKLSQDLCFSWLTLVSGPWHLMTGCVVTCNLSLVDPEGYMAHLSSLLGLQFE